MAQGPIESNRLSGGTTEGRISATANLCGGVAGASGSSRADGFDPSRFPCKFSSVVGPWLVRTLAGTISLSTCENYMIHPFFGHRDGSPMLGQRDRRVASGFRFRAASADLARRAPRPAACMLPDLRDR